MDEGCKVKKYPKGKGNQQKIKKKTEVKKEKMFKVLEVKICLSQTEISKEYEQFIKQNITGEMTKENFIKSSKLPGDDQGFMASSLFRVFDEDNSGTMNFSEYMMASNCSNLGSAQNKLEWIFKVFDEDGGGSIDIDEVIKLVIGLFNMGGGKEDKEVLLACVLDILDVIELDSNGEITRDEFVNNAMKSGFIQNLIGDDDEVCREEFKGI